MADNIDIKGADKAELLAALYNNSKPLGMGFLQYDPTPMTKADAAKIIEKQGLSFDYLKGRVMKIDLKGDTLDTWGYDRDNGAGAAAKAIASIKTAETAPSQTVSTGSNNKKGGPAL